MAEWSKALVLGTSHFDGVGSNPTTASLLFMPFLTFTIVSLNPTTANTFFLISHHSGWLVMVHCQVLQCHSSITPVEMRQFG